MELHDLKQRVLQRRDELATIRRPWEPVWQDCARLVSPIKARYLTRSGPSSPLNSPAQSSRSLEIGNAKLLDTYGTYVWRIITNGMTSGLTSASRPWFKWETLDSDLNEYKSVRLWLAEVERRMYQRLSASNYYNAVKTGYGAMSLFGVEAAIMSEDIERGIVTYPLSIGEFYVGLNEALAPDTLYRRCDMTTIQLYHRFVRDRYASQEALPRTVRDAYNASRYHEYHEVWNAIEPNYEREMNSDLPRDLPFRSLWWANGCERQDYPFMSVSGFHEQPFWAPRWDVEGSDTYGTCPAMDALGDLRELQVTKLRKGQVRDYIARPPLKAPYSMQDRMRATTPGSVNHVAPVDEGSFKPVWEVDPTAIQVLAAEQEENRAAIRRHFHTDIFLAISQMEGVQPRNIEEILARQDEQMAQMGPVVERALDEKLKVGLDRLYGIMMRRGEFPEPPDELRGQPLKLTFVSVLAQLQRAQGIRQLERFSGFVGNLAGVDPSVLDKFDRDQAVDEYADATGVRPTVVRSDEEVEQLRKQRAAQQKAAQSAATAAPMMAAAKDGAQAAELLSRTDTGDGASMLEKVLGTGS